jgi:hypothetical protein
MRKYMRKSTSLTLDAETVAYVRATKGDRSTSGRVNDLLKRAMLLDRYEKLEAEAAAFFVSEAPVERKGRRALQKAAVRSLSRD